METNRDKQENNTQNGQQNFTLQDLVTGKEKVQEIKDKLQSAEGKDAGQTVASTREIEDKLYPKDPEIVTNQKVSYGD